jgi:hypothetical protein
VLFISREVVRSTMVEAQCFVQLASSPAVAPPLVPTVSSTYKKTVVAGLYLQAATVLNVRQLVNIVLDSSTNYVCWRDLMK